MKLSWPASGDILAWSWDNKSKIDYGWTFLKSTTKVDKDYDDYYDMKILNGIKPDRWCSRAYYTNLLRSTLKLIKKS